MTYADFVATMPAPSDPRGRRARATDERLVRRLADFLAPSPVDITKTKWASLVKRLRAFTPADWAAVKARGAVAVPELARATGAKE